MFTSSGPSPIQDFVDRTWDYQGNATIYTDRNGVEHHSAYQPASSQSIKTANSGSDSYSLNTHLNSDGSTRQLEEHYTSGGVRQYESVINYVYDELGRVTTSDIDFGMDGDSTSFDSQLGFGYGADGRLDSRSVSVNANPGTGSLVNLFTDSFDYDAAGNVTDIDQTISTLAATAALWQGGVTPDDKSVRFTYNADGGRATMQRVQSVTDIARSDYDYNPARLDLWLGPQRRHRQLADRDV